MFQSRKFSLTQRTDVRRERANKFLANWYENADNMSYLIPRGMKAKWEVYNYFNVKSGCRERSQCIANPMYWECGEIQHVCFYLHIFADVKPMIPLCFASNDIASIRVSFQLLSDVLKKCSKHVIYYSVHARRLHTVAEPTRNACTNAKYCIINPVLYFQTYVHPEVLFSLPARVKRSSPALYQRWMRRRLRRVWK